jgi:hypothetical protein
MIAPSISQNARAVSQNIGNLGIEEYLMSLIIIPLITWQESSQCVTESSPSVQTCRLSVVRDVQRSVASRSRHNSTGTHQSAEPSNAHNLYNPPLSLVHLQTRGLIPRYTLTWSFVWYINWIIPKMKCFFPFVIR